MYTYWTNTANFIWRENNAGEVSFWMASRNAWSEWFNRAHCEEGDVEAGWGRWTRYNGPMPDGAVVDSQNPVITNKEEAFQALVDTFVNGTALESQHIVDVLGAHKVAAMARFEVRQTDTPGVYGIWNPNRRSWVKNRSTDQNPALFCSREGAGKICDKLNEKFGR